MTESTVVHGTFTIERTYAAPPARVFAAFANEATKRRWFAEGKGSELDEFSVDFRVGGREKSRFRFTGGPPGAPPPVAPSGGGTRLTFTEQAVFFERSDGASLREQGWRSLLQQLDVEVQKGA